MNAPKFSFQERPALKKRLSSEVFDILIIGGGITGAAVARDASLRGLKVALIEADDFASGTSSGSTKLIHGGLRYLQMYDFKLVFEAIQEREKLKKLYAPFVQDLDFVFPTYEKVYPPRWQLNLGLYLYDSFSFFQEHHQNLTTRSALEKFPYLKSDGLTGACVYADSFAEDYRLVIELIKSSHRHGGICLSRMKAIQFKSSNLQSGFKTEVQDVWENDSPFEIESRFVFNCSGPFSDQVRSLLNLPKALQLTQGVHFILPHEKLPVKKAFVCSDPKMNRILFAIPWNSVTYIGTTDTSLDRPEDAQAHAEDVEYVLSIINHYFKKQLTRADVTQSWAAVRPLLAPPGSKSNSQISREHHIEENPKNLIHILGGKLTSHRLMAEEALDRLQGRIAMKKSQTLKHPLQETAYPKKSLSGLERRQGWEADLVLKIDQEQKLNGKKLIPECDISVAEVLHSIEYEMALDPLDFIRRRSSLYYEYPNAEMAEKVSQVFEQAQKQSGGKLEVSPKKTLQSFTHDQKGY